MLLVMKNLSLLLILGITSFLFITGCQTTNEGNLIQRAYILDKNEKSITIEHSKLGKTIAFQKAREWADSLGKIAVYKSSSQQYGPDVISTWSIE